MSQKKIEQKLLEIVETLPSSNVLGLYNGEAGKALFYAYISLYLNKEKYLDKTEKCLLNIFQEIKNEYINSSFCGGISGILWGITHLKSIDFIELEDNLNFMLPNLKMSALKYAEADNFDFLHGSGGIIYYLLDTDSVDESFVNDWLNLLHKKVHKIEGKYIWKTLLDIETGKKVYNLSLAHGVSSTIIVLAEILKKFPENKLASDLINGSIKYLLSYKKDNTDHNVFPSYISEESDGSKGRLAWCYGDLGNAIALWRAGNLLSNEYWKKQALDILIHSSCRRDLQKNGLGDASFCHGTSGVAHIFNRFYKETKIKEFDDARWYWLNKTLDMSKWVDGLAGYKTYSGKDKEYKPEYNLLEGVSGIGLVLLGFLTDDIEDISWDRCLMLS